MIRNAITIGLTGMSGSGKSTAREIFRESGFEIIDCDHLCRVIVEKGKPCLKEIEAFFGGSVILPDGQLDRRETARQIFSDEEKRESLGGIMYPYVSYIIIDKLFSCPERTFFLLDAPTLFESGIDDICDGVVSIAADINICAERIQKRDGIGKAQALSRLSSQHDAEYYRSRSRYFAENNGGQEEFAEKIREIICAVRSDFKI